MNSISFLFPVLSWNLSCELCLYFDCIPFSLEEPSVSASEVCILKAPLTSDTSSLKPGQAIKLWFNLMFLTLITCLSERKGEFNKIHVFSWYKRIKFTLRIFSENVLTKLQNDDKILIYYKLGLKFFSLIWIVCILEMKMIKHRIGWITSNSHILGYIGKSLSRVPTI